LGGHFRIPLSALNLISPREPELSAGIDSVGQPVAYQYCWEYLAGGGDIKSECQDCITFRSRARRCYELKDLPGGLGCLNLLCDTNCEDCDYYKLVSGQAINILIISENKNVINDADNINSLNGYRLKFAKSEYQAAVMIQSFRPDYIVVDCALGKKRTGGICASLFNDIRIPVVRIILSSKSKKIHDYCDREVFGWIKKPFVLDQLKSCIRGVPESEIKSLSEYKGDNHA